MKGWDVLMIPPETYLLVISHSCGKSHFLMGKSTISMVMFNSYVKLLEGKDPELNCCCVGLISSRRST